LRENDGKRERDRVTATLNEDKATRYHRLGRRARVLSTASTCVILVALLASGASARLSDWTSSVADNRPYLSLALYLLILSAILDLLTLPFSFYRGFALERRYGLATQALRHWLWDHVKATIVGLVFAALGGIFVYFALRTSPEYWWLIAGAGYSLVTVILVNLAPVVLLPVFFTFRPLERAALRERLTALAAKSGTRVVGVYEWTLSDRTKKGNAALTGIGNTRRILLSDTLLADYSDDEIEVILAHELAHHVHRDIRTGVLADTVVMFAVFLLGHQALRWAVPVFGLRHPADPAGLPVLLVTAGAVALCVKPVLNAMSRAHERRADAYALRMTGNPSAFISAMRRLGRQNLAEENPSSIVQALFYTHPPIKERVKAAEQWTVA
jgi:STE24 endopeptidase